MTIDEALSIADRASTCAVPDKALCKSLADAAEFMRRVYLIDQSPGTAANVRLVWFVAREACKDLLK
jgi:hypothetical protein